MRILRFLFPSPFRIHRLVEVLSVLLFLVFSLLYAWKLSELGMIPFQNSMGRSLITLVGISFAAYLTADFLSGFVHFLGDSFGDENTPYLGPAFILPFRDHHTDPKGITRHDFVETNGNNCLVSLPILLFLFFAPGQEGEFPLARTYWFLVLIGIFFTNQIHKWAHQEEPNSFIRFLQKKRWILSPEHHQIHHTVPYDSYFCITTGWWNRILHKLGFFPFVKRMLLGIFRPFLG